MKKLLFITVLLCGLFLVSCAQESEDDSPVQTDLDYEVQTDYETEDDYEAETEEEETYTEELPDPVVIDADFEVEVIDNGSFIITTNLPDETELSLKLKGRAYLAQGKAVVEGGVAVSEHFTNKGNPLFGDYELEVLMPIPSVQSDYVKHFIGEDGEYLTGPYIKPALGSVVVSKTFDVSFDFADEQDSEIDEEETTSGETTSDETTTDHTSDGNYYATPTGKKYHLDPDCGGKNSYKTSNISSLTPCAKCAQ